jgi:hypothetical protein
MESSHSHHFDLKSSVPDSERQPTQPGIDQIQNNTAVSYDVKIEGVSHSARVNNVSISGGQGVKRIHGVGHKYDSNSISLHSTGACDLEFELGHCDFDSGIKVEGIGDANTHPSIAINYHSQPHTHQFHGDHGQHNPSGNRHRQSVGTAIHSLLLMVLRDVLRMFLVYQIPPLCGFCQPALVCSLH